MNKKRIAGAVLALVAIVVAVWALSEGGRTRLRYWALIAKVMTTANFDEDAVPDYTLPDPLVTRAGQPVETPEAWRGRREEILASFRSEVYGDGPDSDGPIDVQEIELGAAALAGRALRHQWRLSVGGREIDLVLYTPADAAAPVPVFLGLNFRGNHTIHPDPEIRLTQSWIPYDPDGGVENHRASDRARGVRSSRWPVESIALRGYGLATVYSGDIAADRDDAGVEEAIAAWAWGLRRALDHLGTVPVVDPSRVIVFGHSRLGKAALWAGAQDERFAIVVSNDSGCLGAALSRRRFGESVAFITDVFPHWFSPALRKYADDEDALPVDQHMLLALVAPRPLYVASAEDDRWADPLGEFLSARAASPVYALHGIEGLPVDEMPAVGQPVAGAVGYHIRSGGHDIRLWDWERFLDFADAHLGPPTGR